MSTSEAAGVRLIKKYPNRRYYDTQSSTHVTLQQMHSLVLSGQDLQVVDSKTGEDITNLVLLQIILEREHVKLDLFPSSIIHTMIRSNRQVLRASLESFFGPFWSVLSQSRSQFDSFWREIHRGSARAPVEWANSIAQGMNVSAASGATHDATEEDQDMGNPDLKPSDSGPTHPTPAPAWTAGPPQQEATSRADSLDHKEGTAVESSDKREPNVPETVLEDLKKKLADLATRIDGLDPKRPA